MEGRSGRALEMFYGRPGVRVGGRAGGLAPGRHIVAPDGTHPGNVLIGAMQAAGSTDDKFGEVTGKFADLFG